MPTVPAARAFTRREGLLAAALLLPAGVLAACSGDAAPAPGAPTSGSAAADGTPAASTATEVATEEAALIALYDTALAGLPADDRRRDLLTGIREQHAAHLDAVAATPDDVAVDTLPVDPDALLGALARAERQASRSRIRAGESADGDLARLLVLIAASESGHAAELRRART